MARRQSVQVGSVQGDNQSKSGVHRGSTETASREYRGTDQVGIRQVGSTETEQGKSAEEAQRKEQGKSS